MRCTGILLLCIVIIIPCVYCQGYFGLAEPGYLPVSQESDNFSIAMHRVSDKGLDFDIKGRLYELGLEFEFGRSGSFNIHYFSGDLDIEPDTFSYDYMFTAYGEYSFSRELSMSGSIGVGKTFFNDDEASTGDYSLGMKFADYQEGVDTEIVINMGKFETLDGKKNYSGIEVNLVESREMSGLKWYLGRVGGENLVSTSIRMPLLIDPEAGGFALFVDWVIVNSHHESKGSRQLVSYGTVLGDWTEHQEWLVSFIYGLDRKYSDWSLSGGYGLYRTKRFSQKDDSIMMHLEFKYYF